MTFSYQICAEHEYVVFNTTYTWMKEVGDHSVSVYQLQLRIFKIHRTYATERGSIVLHGYLGVFGIDLRLVTTLATPM